MTGFLYELLMMSASGSVMFLISTLVYRQTKIKYAGWYYALVITSILLMLLPLQRIFTVPKAITVEVPQSIGTGTEAKGIDASYFIFGAWGIGALLCVCKYLYSYFRTLDTLSAMSDLLRDERTERICKEAKKLLGIRRSVGLRKSALVKSPLLFGILRPSIILPDRDFTDAELRMIFTHELTHLKHCDLLAKQAAAVVTAVHWFNPCVYLIRRAVNNGCELCCDEAVLSVLELTDRKDYGRLLLSILEDKGGAYAYTTAMSSKQSIKQRLRRIAEFKKMPAAVRIVFVMLALSMTVCSITAFGFEFAKEAVNEELADIITPVAADIPAAGDPMAEPAPVVPQSSIPAAAESIVPAITQSAAPAAAVRNTSENKQQRAAKPDTLTAENNEYVPRRQPEPVQEEAYTEDTSFERTSEAANNTSVYPQKNDQPSESSESEPKGNVGTGASRSEVNDVMGTPSRISQDGSRETYDLPDGNTAVVQYDGDVMDKGYILVD